MVEWESAQVCKMRWVFCPFLGPEPLVHSSVLQKTVHFVLYPCSKSHHFRFLNCVSYGSVQDTHPTPLVVKQVLAVGSLCAQHCAKYHLVMGLHPPLAPSSTLCYTPSFLHHSPFPQTPSPASRGFQSLSILGAFLSFLLNCWLYSRFHF